MVAVPVSHRPVVPRDGQDYKPYTKLLCVALEEALQGVFTNTFSVSYYGDDPDKLKQISVEFMPKGTSYTVDGKTSTVKQDYYKYLGAITYKKVIDAANDVHEVQTFLKKKKFSFNMNIKDN